jgi:hypothetical protein
MIVGKEEGIVLTAGRVVGDELVMETSEFHLEVFILFGPIFRIERSGQ